MTRSMSKDTPAQGRLAQIQCICPAPATLIQLLQVIDDPEVSMSRLATIVGADAPLTTQLLRLVNSASFGLARQVDNIPDALHFVGVAETKNLAIALALKSNLLGRAPIQRTLDRRSCWRHLLATALISGELARHTEFPAPATAYAAGLLHDFGLLAIDQALGAELQEVETRLGETAPEGSAEADPAARLRDHDPRPDVERQILGFTHREAGASLGREWGLPRTVLRAMLFHDQPWEAPADQLLCALVHVADRIATAHAPVSAAEIPIDPAPQAIQMTGVSEEAMRSIEAQLPEHLDELRDLIELPDDASPEATQSADVA